MEKHELELVTSTRLSLNIVAGRIAPPRDEFIVDSILDFRISHITGARRRGSTLVILTHWDSYDSTHDSWEPYPSLEHVQTCYDFARSSTDLA
jgi:hypothetical protein